MPSANAAMLMSSLGGSGAVTTHLVSRSLRVRGKAGFGYFVRTPSTAGNRRVGAFRVRLKLAGVDTFHELFSAEGEFSGDMFYVDNDGSLNLIIQDELILTTNKKLLACDSWAVDVGCWWDTTQANAADRFGITFEGAEPEGGYATDNRALIAQNTEINYHDAQPHTLLAGAEAWVCEPAAVDGSTSINYSVLNNSTGEYDPVEPNAVWGTNGFWLPLDDISSGGANIGNDSSGNGNHWTAVGIDLNPASDTFDSSVDVPTPWGVDTGVGGEVRGNYPVMVETPNRETVAFQFLTGIFSDFLSDGNLFQAEGEAVISFPFVDDVYQFEVTAGLSSVAQDAIVFSEIGTWGQAGGTISSLVYYFLNGSYLDLSSMSPVAIGDSPADGDILGFKVDADSGTVAIYINGDLQGTLSSLDGGKPVLMLARVDEGNSLRFNFGQRPFAYPIAGAKTLNTASLPVGTIKAAGSFAGTEGIDPHSVWVNGRPDTVTINGNAVTWGTHALRTSTGFNVITDSVGYNSSAGNNFTATGGTVFRYARAKLQ